MSNSCRFFCLLSMVCSSVFATESGSLALNQLSFYTEEYPPYNFTENGQLKGLAVDYLLLASERANSSIDTSMIKVQPWPRAYRNAVIKPGSVLFSTTRTAIREPLFKWAGPIGVTRVVVLAKRTKQIVIRNSSDLAQYRIGVVRDDVGEQLLLELGVPRDSMSDSTVPETLAKQLAKNRIDLWAYEENVAVWWLRKSGYDKEDFEVVHVLSEGELYYAFHKDLPDVLVNQLQEGLDGVKEMFEHQGRDLQSHMLERYH